MFAKRGDKVSGISTYLGGTKWSLSPSNKCGVFAFFDVSDFTDSTVLIGQPVVLVPDDDYILKAVPAASNTNKSSVIAVFLGYEEGGEPIINKTKADAEADGVYAVQIGGLVDEARVTESSGFVKGDILQLINAGTSFIKSAETDLFDPEACGVAGEACSAGTAIALRKVVLSYDYIHEIPGS